MIATPRPWRTRLTTVWANRALTDSRRRTPATANGREVISPYGIAGVDTDQRLVGDLGDREAGGIRQAVAFGQDDHELAGADLAEGERGVVEAVAGGDELAPLQQQVFDGLLDLQHVQVDVELGEAAAHLHHRARGDELGDGGHRGEGELGIRPRASAGRARRTGRTSSGGSAGSARRPAPPRPPAAKSPALRSKRRTPRLSSVCLSEAADPRRRHVQEFGRALDRPGHHHGADDLDLSQREIRHGRATSSPVAVNECADSGDGSRRRPRHPVVSPMYMRYTCTVRCNFGAAL